MDRVIIFRPARLSEIILQHCYFHLNTAPRHPKTTRKRREVELRARIAKHLSGRGRPPDAAMLSNHLTISEENNATQAPEGGTQDANCGAPERTRPTYRRIRVKVPSSN